MLLINLYYVLHGADFQSSIQNVKYSEKSEQEVSHKATASSNTGCVTYFSMIQLSLILFQVQVLQNTFIFLFQWSSLLNLPHWDSTNHNYAKQHSCFIIIKYHIYSEQFYTSSVQLLISTLLCATVQLSHSVMSDSLRPHELQHARPPCPSPTPGVHSDSRPSSQ